ncbi:hypothetical protein CDAR_278531 [Caerostris darwini]|uniref:Uncharacterized protein n=1 Tax=Caerostris darwini TaxID=1538125 RepID=A0AAV4WS10_9ARAC|nr:hypothetical protein CDAR_278531 [Caerostris darwini]
MLSVTEIMQMIAKAESFRFIMCKKGQITKYLSFIGVPSYLRHQRLLMWGRPPLPAGGSRQGHLSRGQARMRPGPFHDSMQIRPHQGVEHGTGAFSVQNLAAEFVIAALLKLLV